MLPPDAPNLHPRRVKAARSVAWPEKPKAAKRAAMKKVAEADADIIPEPEKGILRARVPGMAGKAMDKTVAPLPEALNKTETKFPDTDSR